MYKAIKKNKGKLFSVLMVTFLFVLDHAGQLFRSPVLLGYIGLIGIILILIRIFNKNLVNCIIFHFIYNLTVIVLANIALFRTLFLID
jgi:membrane protease YdiL (CAAX protease family)